MSSPHRFNADQTSIHQRHRVPAMRPQPLAEPRSGAIPRLCLGRRPSRPASTIVNPQRWTFPKTELATRDPSPSRLERPRRGLPTGITAFSAARNLVFAATHRRRIPVIPQRFAASKPLADARSDESHFVPRWDDYSISPAQQRTGRWRGTVRSSIACGQEGAHRCVHPRDGQTRRRCPYPAQRLYPAT